VVELRCAGKPEHGDSRDARIVTELIYGKAGWLERLGFKAVEERRVSWASLSRVERSLLTIRAGEMGRLKSRHQIDGPLKIHS
jgi:hypothetical protein